METALFIACLALLGCVLLGEFFEKAAAVLKQWTATLALLAVVAILIVQASPRAWKLLKQRGGEITKPVAAVVHAPSHR